MLKRLENVLFLSEKPAVCTTLNGGRGTVLRGVKCPKSYCPRLQLSSHCKVTFTSSSLKSCNGIVGQYSGVGDVSFSVLFAVPLVSFGFMTQELGLPSPSVDFVGAMFLRNFLLFLLAHRKSIQIKAEEERFYRLIGK